MVPNIILIVSEDKTKGMQMTGDGLERALESVLQYLYDSIDNLQDFEIWLCYPNYTEKYPLLNFIEMLHIKKRDFYQRLHGIYTGKHLSFDLLKRGLEYD